MNGLKQNKTKGFTPLILVLVIAIIAVLILVAWMAWQAQANKSMSETSQGEQYSAVDGQSAPNQGAVEIAELGVVFDKNDQITPLYKISDYTYDGVAYKLIWFSTEQVVDAGVKNMANGKNPCHFDSAAPWSDADHALVTVSAYDTQADLLAIEKNDRSDITAADIKPENGYISTGGKFFAVPLPGTVQPGTGNCTDAALEGQQRTMLEQALLTLRTKD